MGKFRDWIGTIDEEAKWHDEFFRLVMLQVEDDAKFLAEREIEIAIDQNAQAVCFGGPHPYRAGERVHVWLAKNEDTTLMTLSTELGGEEIDWSKGHSAALQNVVEAVCNTFGLRPRKERLE